MPKKQKLGKTRLDKYYHLAKQQGYRSRAAYKLIQLNQKFNFLENASILIDLCAAPGSWLQVATKYMPVTNRQIIGVDLVPIKPIPNVTTFAEDITGQRCRALLKKELKDRKADVVLHDGAPNVGVSWVKDAYTQAELTLSATKLATEFLAPNGIFVTKVFRSAEYTKVMWVLNQLFRKVTATKPQASRTVSAEIFVVCQGYLAPKFIDPKLLDPRYVFKDVDTPAQPRNVLNEKPSKKHKDVPYPEGVALLYKECSVADFVESLDPVTMLGEYNRFVFDERAKKYLEHPATNNEIKACMEDLKVLNKKDFRGLLKWRDKMQQHFSVKEEQPALEGVEKEEKRELTPEEEEQLRLEELNMAAQRVAQAAKRKEKKRREHTLKQRKRMAFQTEVLDEFDAPGAEEDELFNLKRLRHPNLLTALEQNDQPDAVLEGSSSDEEEEAEENEEVEIDSDDDDAYNRYVEEQLERMYQQYTQAKAKKADLLQSSKYDEDTNMDVDIKEEEDENMQDGPREGLLMKDMLAQPTVTQRTAMWFDQDIFKDAIDEDLDEQVALSKLQAVKKRKVSETNKVEIKQEKQEANDEIEYYSDEEDEEEVDEVEIKKEDENDENIDGEDGDEEYIDEDVDDDDDDDDDDSSSEASFDEVPLEKLSDEEMSDSELDDEEKAQIMAIAMKMANKHDRRKIIDHTFNKYAYTDHPDLPWFNEDEAKHNRPVLPVTDAEIAEMKKKLKAIDVKTPKKVLEAKARKKRKFMRALERAKSKVAAVFASEELSTAEKVREIERIYKRIRAKNKKPKKVYVVAGRVKGKIPKGARLKFVDRRMKKDKRAELARQRKRKRRSGKR